MLKVSNQRPPSMAAWCVAALLGATVSWPARPAELASPDSAYFESAKAWLFPLNAPSAAVAAPPDDKVRLHLPNSSLSFTQAQLTNLFRAPDWHPKTHVVMPEIVAQGRAPDVYACGYCHLPNGQGRPENSALAGLPAAYIMQQVADMKSGARRSPAHGDVIRPADLMQRVADHATVNEVRVAADYFSSQTLRPRVTVIERAVIPRMQVMGWVYVKDPFAGEEALGQRLIEWTRDLSRHEKRDDIMRYVTFVPPGSVRRGRGIAMTGQAPAAACTSCHGERLQGIGLVPPLAGRSPTYLLRQLVGFKTGDRQGETSAAMKLVAATLQIDDMIAVVAYAATQSPAAQPRDSKRGDL